MSIEVVRNRQEGSNKAEVAACSLGFYESESSGFLDRSRPLEEFGLALGLPTAALLGRSMRGLLYGVEPLDPATLVSVAVIVFATALTAATVPAWRAANVDPLDALRHE